MTEESSSIKKGDLSSSFVVLKMTAYRYWNTLMTIKVNNYIPLKWCENRFSSHTGNYAAGAGVKRCGNQPQGCLGRSPFQAECKPCRYPAV